MRVIYAIMFLLGFLARYAFGQTHEPRVHSRPGYEATGTPQMTMPMMIIEEAVIDVRLFEEIPFPAEPWNQAKACVERMARDRGFELAPLGEAPKLLVPGYARSIRVSDATMDSLDYAEDSTHVGTNWSDPTIAYSLIRTQAVVVVDRYRENVPVLRHEALHFILWRGLRLFGHPQEFFIPCDKDYE